MLGHTIMIQGTASHVGKSVLCAALCRWLVRRGWSVTPFKAQNMSLNSAVTRCGGEIGRSQAFQAAACGIEPVPEMNPVLLKPMSGGRCQVIVRGRPYRIAEARTDATGAREALRIAEECLAALRRRFDVVVIEGMGSPAEINLGERETANMPVAALADSPVLLAGDIERGGVFASLAGTLELLRPDDRARVKGLLINKLHGDPEVLRPGTEELARRYGVPTAGVLPWIPELRVEEEDAVSLSSSRATGVEGQVDVVVPRLPGISNFTDLLPLEQESGVQVRYVDRPEEWGTPDLVVLPGSRSVAADLEWLRRSGLVERVTTHAASGGRIVGLCGGYQMLGRRIRDPEEVEGRETQVEGLGLLDVVTTFAPGKTVRRTAGVSRIPGLEGPPVQGYEIHHGASVVSAETLSALSTDAGPDGASTPDGRIFGAYLHGLFDSEAFRRRLLELLGHSTSGRAAEDDVFDHLADWWDRHVDSQLVTSLIERSPTLNDSRTQDGSQWREME